MIKIFNKKKEITIQTNDVPVHILKKFIVPFPSNIPKYFKDIPKSFFDNQKRIVRSSTTIRTCSGFINLFKRSILFTCPYDIELFIDRHEIRGSVGPFPWSNFIQKHADWQFIQYAKTNYDCVLKFSPQVSVQCNQNLIVTNPWWHMNDFETIPGIINCKEAMELNVFIAVKKGQNHLYIPQGAPLCYINVETEDSIKLVYKDKKFKQSDNLGLSYTFSNLKRKLVTNLLKK